GAVAILLVGEAGVTCRWLETWEACLLARLHSLEECLVGCVQASEHILEHLRVEGGGCGKRGAPVLEVGFLLGAGDALALPAAPPGDPLLQGNVMEDTAMPQDALQVPLLLWGRGECLLERLADGAQCAPRVLFSVCLLHGTSLPHKRPIGKEWGLLAEAARRLTARPQRTVPCGGLQPFPSKRSRRRGREDVAAPDEELVQQLRAAALDAMAVALVEHQLLGFTRLGVEYT